MKHWRWMFTVATATYLLQTADRARCTKALATGESFTEEEATRRIKECWMLGCTFFDSAGGRERRMASNPCYYAEVRSLADLVAAE